jgi:PKD repeat protein
VTNSCAGHSAVVTVIPGGSEPFYAKGAMAPAAANPTQPGAPATPPPTGPTGSSGTPAGGGTTPVTLTPPPPLPTARFKLATAHPRARHKLVFDARASREVGGTIVAYRWKFGDGRTGKGRKVKHAYRKPGRYKVTLTVVDAAGHKATKKLTIRVKR